MKAPHISNDRVTVPGVETNKQLAALNQKAERILQLLENIEASTRGR